MRRIIIIIIVIVSFFSCQKKESNSTSTQSVSVDYLSDEQLQILDNAGSDTSTKFTDLVFSDGTKLIDWENRNDSGYQYILTKRMNPASDQRRQFIDAMLHVANLLTNRDSFKIITNQNNGLAYVFGSRHISKPVASAPVDATHPAVCQEKLWGLDCSGMIYQMATAIGLNLIGGTTTEYSKIDTWNTAFKDINSPEFNGLHMVDSPALKWNLMQEGDIVVSIGTNNHIGIIYRTAKFNGMYHSHGSPNYTCLVNTGHTRGPDKTPMIVDWVTKMFGTNYHVLRVVQNGKPGLTTKRVTNVTSTSATSGGIVTENGGSNIKGVGLCWSTSANVSVADMSTKDVLNNDNTFTSNLLGLSSNTKFYVRAYATNDAGTSYGSLDSFRTSSNTSPTPFDITGSSWLFTWGCGNGLTYQFSAGAKEWTQSGSTVDLKYPIHTDQQSGAVDCYLEFNGSIISQTEISGSYNYVLTRGVCSTSCPISGSFAASRH